MAPAAGEDLLTVEGLSKRFGGLLAVADVGFRLPAGRVLGLIGPNGSGKTTLLNVLSGVYLPDAGAIRFEGRSLVGVAPHRLAGLGIGRTFQNARVFHSLTAFENLRLAASGAGRGLEDLDARAGELLESVGLEGARDQAASELSGGQQKLLEFVRAIVPRPRLLLMDEPFAGVHPELIRTMVAGIARERAAGTAVVVVSHEIPVLMSLADEVVCMNQGAVVCAGPPDVVARDERVVEAYLGAPAVDPTDDRPAAGQPAVPDA